jgi:predicted DNA-binding transcriptional regulator AlpA
MYMHDNTQNQPTFNDVPVFLANIDEKLGIIVEWIQSGASQQDPHAILTIDEAVAFTGYSKSAIHSATSKDTIPHFKRGNKLFFFKDELVEWLKSDNRPKRGKRFQDNNSSKESVVTDGNQESVSIAEETANDTNSVAEVLDTTSNQAEKAASVPEEAVSTCQSPEISPSSEVVSDAELEQIGSDDESKDTSTERASTSGTDVDSCMDGHEEMTTGNDSLADEHISNDSVEQQGTEPTIPSFPFFSLERHEASDGSVGKTVIHFFKNIAYEHFRPVCNTGEKYHGNRIDRSVNFEFATYEYALQAAQEIDSFMSPRPSVTN